MFQIFYPSRAFLFFLLGLGLLGAIIVVSGGCFLVFYALEPGIGKIAKILSFSVGAILTLLGIFLSIRIIIKIFISPIIYLLEDNGIIGSISKYSRLVTINRRYSMRVLAAVVGLNLVVAVIVILFTIAVETFLAGILGSAGSLFFTFIVQTLWIPFTPAFYLALYYGLKARTQDS